VAQTGKQKSEHALPLTGLDAYEFPVLASLCETNLSFDLGEERIIPSFADIGARMKPRTSLSNENAARGDHLATEGLDAEHLGIRVPPVL